MNRITQASPLPPVALVYALALGSFAACGGVAESDKQGPAKAQAAKELTLNSTPFQPRSAAASDSEQVDSDWPQWRGPQRGGRSPESNIARQLPAEGPLELWRRPFGPGFSGISIAQGWLLSCMGEGASSFLLRLDPDTGEEVWRYRMGELFKERYGDGPRSTPTIDEGIVYVMTSRAVVIAVDGASGQELWKTDLGQEFAIKKLEFRGYASSPLIEGELAIIQVGPTDGKSLVALNKTSGEIEWTALDGRSAFSSPLAATIAGKRQVLSTIAAGIAGVDALTGETLWEFPWITKFDVSVATPIFIAPDRVFLSVGYDQGAVMLSVDQEAGAWKAESLWSNRRFRNHFASSIHHDGHFYGFDESMLKCISSQDGAEKWKHRGLGKGTLLFADGLLIVLGEKGLLSLIEASPEAFKELGSVAVFDDRSWTTPTLAAGRLYLRDTKEMVCLDLRSKSPLTPTEQR